MYIYYRFFFNFAGPAQKSMSVETAILFKIVICLSVHPFVYLLVLITHNGFSYL